MASPLTEQELAYVEAAAGREPGNVLARLVAELRDLRRRARAAEQQVDAVRVLHSDDGDGACTGCGLTSDEEPTPIEDCQTRAALDAAE